MKDYEILRGLVAQSETDQIAIMGEDDRRQMNSLADQLEHRDKAQEEECYISLRNQVKQIAQALTEGFGVDDEDMEEDTREEIEEYGSFAAWYLSDALDIEYIVSGVAGGGYIGARVLVAFGGPNIWIDTRQGIVEGYWWGDSFADSFTDSVGLNEYLSELWECR